MKLESAFHFEQTLNILTLFYVYRITVDNLALNVGDQSIVYSFYTNITGENVETKNTLKGKRAKTLGPRESFNSRSEPSLTPF